MVKVEWFYWLCAAAFLVTAIIRLRDRSDAKRYGSALFWSIVAFCFCYGTFVVNKTAPALVEGVAVLCLVVLAALGYPGRGTVETTDDATRERSAARLGNWLFVPALVIPAVAGLFAVMGMRNLSIGGRPLFEAHMATIIGLGAAAIIALGVAMAKFRVSNPAEPFREGDRLLGHIGWAAILPQFLATLGMLFKDAGVGEAVGRVTKMILPDGKLLAAVAVYCIGMALFTIVMGNAFAAFPVMTAAVGWPVLVEQFHGSPAPIFAIGMLAGFCGTLCTPMAANFNLVPAALLELKDSYGPIKAQVPTALPLLLVNIVIMYLVSFPGVGLG
ncbi:MULTISPECIES: DUF979 domain-containing protein [unclassified Luteococcus]|uniref:DUF979 domain-containing protein n=1 Tax=unclassified Luteococcus TaxID=2639923 RepID=UPI00313AC644